MTTPARRSGPTRDCWIARAAELKAELMARRNPLTASSHLIMDLPSKIESPKFVHSISSGSHATVTTIALASAPDNLAYTLHETDVQEKSLKDQVDELLACDTPRSQSPPSSSDERLSPHALSAHKHASPAPTKPSVNGFDHKKHARTEDFVVLGAFGPTMRQSIHGSTGDETVSSPKQHVDDSQASRVETSDTSKDVVTNGETPKKKADNSQLSKEGTEDIQKGVTHQGKPKSDFDGPQPSQKPTLKEGDAKSNPMFSTTLSMSPVLEKPAASPSQRHASLSSSGTVTHIPKHPAPEKSTSKDGILPSGSRDYKRNSRDLQHSRPSQDTSRTEDKGHRESRSNNRRPLPTDLQRPTRPPTHYRPRDPDVEIDILASQDRDLKDWLVFTGWHNHDYRAGFLRRKRRLANLDREKNEIEQERAELMSADDHAMMAARFRSGSGGADEFEIGGGFLPRNAGRELFNAPLPSNRKRPYASDYEEEVLRKMNRVDSGDHHRRDAARGGRDDYGQRDYYHDNIEEGHPHRMRPGTPPAYHMAAHHGQHAAERGGHHPSLEGAFRRGSTPNVSSAGYRDDDPGPFSSARLENPRSPPPARGSRGDRGGRGARRPYRRGL